MKDDRKYKESFVFVESLYWMLKLLPEDEKNTSLWQIVEYGLFGKIPTEFNDSSLELIFMSARASIDSAKHNRAIRQEAGKIGGSASSRKGVGNGESKQKVSKSKQAYFDEKTDKSKQKVSKSKQKVSKSKLMECNENVNVNGMECTFTNAYAFADVPSPVPDGTGSALGEQDDADGGNEYPQPEVLPDDFWGDG